MSPRQTLSVVVEAWWMAWQRRRPAPGLLHHSDQGNQYHAGGTFLQFPEERVGGALAFQNQANALYATAEYIERFYNRQRLH